MKNLVFSCLLAFLLVSCGSDAIITSDDSKKNIDGRAVDGYLQKSTVCLDLDLDGYCNIGTEPATSTKDDGSYTLALEVKHTSHINFKKAPILVYDGKDADSGQRFTGKLQAPNNGENIIVSPVTTLVHKAIKEDLDAGVISEEDIAAKIEEKKEKLRLALKIPKGTDLLADPVELHKAGQSSLINANISIHQTAKALKSNSTSGDKSEDEMVEDIYKVFAKSLNNLTTSELNEHSLDASNNRLNVVVNKAKTLSQSDQEVAQLFPKEEQKALDAIDSMLKNIEKRFENANNDEESLKKIVALVEEDRLKIEKEFKNLAEDENFSKDIISVIDDDSLQLDESSDTWKVDALQRFLEKELFIDSNLTKDFALVLYSANIQPWEIENKIEKIKDTNTTVYKKIVNAIEEIKVTKQNEQKEKELEKTTSFKAITLPLKLFDINVEQTENNKKNIHYNQVTFQKDKQLTLKKYSFKNGDWSENTNTNKSYILDASNNWSVENETSKSFSLNSNGQIHIHSKELQVVLSEVEEFSDESLFIPELDLKVTPSNGASFNHVKKIQLKDLYELTMAYETSSNININSLEELASYACGTKAPLLRHNQNSNIGLSFNNPTCKLNSTSGMLMEVDFKNNKIISSSAGSWEVITKGDKKILLIKPKNIKGYTKSAKAGIYTIISQLDTQTLYQGTLTKPGVVNHWMSYNEILMDDIKKAIQEEVNLNEEVMCIDIYQPVCGKDKNGKLVTYSNGCYLSTQGATFQYNGKCKEDVVACTLEYDPVCGKDSAGKLVTYGNKCNLETQKATFLYKGECQEENKPVYYKFKDNADDTFIIQLTNPKTITLADYILKNGEGPNGETHIMGTYIRQKVSYNPKWSFHLVPATITFFQNAIEVCDASIEYLNNPKNNLPANKWCPWSSKLVEKVDNLDQTLQEEDDSENEDGDGGNLDEIVCNNVYRPVCAINYIGVTKTYSNRCFAYKENAKVLYYGKCQNK